MVEENFRQTDINALKPNWKFSLVQFDLKRTKINVMMIIVMGELLSMSMDDNNDAIDHLKPQKRKNKSNISEYHLFSLKEGKVKCYLSCICYPAISPTFLKAVLHVCIFSLLTSASFSCLEKAFLKVLVWFRAWDGFTW